MFEVEQNFNLTPEQTDRLLAHAVFCGEKTFTDLYFDTKDFSLTGKDWWLRCRDRRYELKLPIDMRAESMIYQYQEIEDDAEICRALGWSERQSLEAHLSKKQVLPFCTCITTRKTYQKDGFTIVLDHVTYAECDWSFDTCEVELLVPRRGEMKNAAKRISDFAERHGLVTEYLHGKVLEFLSRERPEHFSTLVRRHVVLQPSHR